MLAKAKAKAEAAEAAARAKAVGMHIPNLPSRQLARAKCGSAAMMVCRWCSCVQAEVDAEHGLSDRAAAAKAKAGAKADEFDQKHGVSAKAAEAKKAADAKAAELDEKHGLQVRAGLAAERAKAAEQAAKAKAQQMDEEYGISAKAGAAAAMAGASAAAGAAAALQKSREAAHGQIAKSFYEFDADGSGYLDESEIGEFCKKLGLLLSPEEVHSCSAEEVSIVLSSPSACVLRVFGSDSQLTLRPNLARKHTARAGLGRRAQSD